MTRRNDVSRWRVTVTNSSAMAPADRSVFPGAVRGVRAASAEPHRASEV